MSGAADVAVDAPVVPKGYWVDAKGNFIRAENVSDTDRDTDAIVRKVHAFGGALSEQMWRFREHTQSDVMGLVERVVERYGGRLGGRKGNVQITSFDGRLKVQLAQAERIGVGPELAAAQALVEECVEEWSARGNLKLRALVDAAFRADSTGALSVAQLLRLRRVRIDDARWRRAQDAISDALRPMGKAEYVRLYRRDRASDPWRPVALNLATVRRPERGAETDALSNLVRRVRGAVEEARHCGLAEGEIMEALREAKRRKGAKAPDGAAGE